MTVRFSDLGITVQADAVDNLLDIMRANGIDVAADCGGKGLCGKCVCLVDGERRLACRTAVDSDMTVTLPRSGGDYDILTDSAWTDAGAAETGAAGEGGPDAAAAAIAVDIGTTTIALKLIDAGSGRELWASAALNAQRPYGADVISRINASMDDSSLLSGIITEQIDGMISRALADSGTDARSVSRVVIAGNTTMSYLLLGFPCRSLGLAPFEPAFPLEETYSYEEVFRSGTTDAPVCVMPFISAYVGGDITAGLLACGGFAPGASGEAGSGDGSYMLVDMGTNGEIVYHSGGRLLCTSTAAGPAFEGGNISCGSGSVEGAISKVCARDGKIGFETIGGAPARSVCGSGLLDAMAFFVSEGVINSSGAMDANSPYVTDGSVVIADDSDTGGAKISLTQRDVREFQLAKSAVRSGIETLIGEFGGRAPDTLYLAGGFGQRLDADSAFTTGLLPESVRGRVIAVGNSSLAGAAAAAANAAKLKEAASIATRGKEINLASHPEFNQRFMEYMIFE
jgi:uncharacterized 2Fe-2S/4Fe-4S cluster protein (DUF4445 family)